MANFCVSFRLLESNNLCGIFDIQMKVPLTEEIYREVCYIVETRFHFVLTHTQQEGILEESPFCAITFRDVLLAVEEVGSLFGEDATVVLDRNMAFYREAGMENLFGQAVGLHLGAPHRSEGEGEGEGENIYNREWDFVPLAEGWRQLLA